MERGLKKRFQMYNRWLSIQGAMPAVDKESVDIVFTVQMPVDETGIVDIVTKLQNIVDDETLLSLLWFVKDPAATLEKVRAQKAEAQKQYFDTFALEQRSNAITGERDEDYGAEGRASGDKSLS